MDETKLDMAIQALKGAATSIGAAIEDESITGLQAYCLLRVIAEQLEALKPARNTPAF
jgi:hypothetical protein